MFKNQHIVHIIDELRVGGAQTHLLTMLVSAKKTYEIGHTVICLFGENHFADDLNRLGVNVICLKQEEKIRKKCFVSAVEEIKKYLLTINPSHVELHLTWSRILGGVAAWLADVPKIFAFEHGDIYLNSVLIRIANFISQFFLDKIFVCSKSLAELFKSRNAIKKNKIRVFPNAISRDKFNTKNIIPKENLGFKFDTFLFCAVGTMGLGVNKRFDIVIKAFSELIKSNNNIGLVICGDGELKPDLEALSTSLMLSSKVKFLGTRGDVPAIMSACDGFCHAAPYEPFGLVIIEAMFCGIPVIVPDTGGPTEIVENKVTGLIYKSLNILDLADKMKLLLQDKDLRVTLALNGQRHAIDKYEITAYMSRLYEIYGMFNE